MNLIESTQQAPLASEEKSLDKLEIELEEKEHMIKSTDGPGNETTKNINGIEVVNPLANTEKIKGKKDIGGVEENGSISTPRRTILNMKIPQILRKRSKERPPDQQQQEEGGKISNEDEKTEMNKKKVGDLSEEETTNATTPVPITVVTVEGIGIGKEQMTETISPLTLPSDEQHSEKQDKEKKDKEKGGHEHQHQEKAMDTSFMSSFTTPKWTNFRRVFSFNRSTPTTLMINKKSDSKSEVTEPVSVTLDIPEDFARTEESVPVVPLLLGDIQISRETNFLSSKKNKKTKSPETTLTTTTTTTNTTTTSGEEKEEEETKKSVVFSESEKSFITPLIRLFRNKRVTKSPQEKDLESGEVATELLEKEKEKLSGDGDGDGGGGGGENGIGQKEGKKKKKNMGDVEEEQTDGETLKSSSFKQENKLSEEVSNMSATGVGGESKEKGSGKGIGSETPSVKPTPKLWRQRITRFPRFNKWILAGICTILVLLAILIAIFTCRGTRAIDIGTLIIEGKYINTITSCGPIQGIVENGGYAFRGIPFALPPVGELRWKHAKTHHHLHHCWNGTYLAHNHSMPCWQFYRNGSYDGSEDCLYLDVYTPKIYYDTPVPVVVYIGGESLNGGQSSSLRPSAALARAKNVLFVSVSIRRSVLGFLTSDILTMNSYPMTSGNYGLSDLMAALKWVKYNVEHFGGDKHHVTLLGHQAGASLVSAFTTSHLSEGLFHQVWLSGGSPPSTLINFQESQTQNAKFLKEVSCTSIECLHNKGPEELLESVPYDWRAFHQDLPTKGEVKHHWLVRDGLILRDPVPNNGNNKPLGGHEGIPFVAGAPAEVDASPEMFSFLDWNDTSKFSAYLESKLGSFGPSLSREVIDRYFRPESTPWQQFVSLLSDVRTICPLYYTTNALAQQYLTKIPIYFYVVTQRKHTPIGFVADVNADISAILGIYETETKEEKQFVKNMQELFYEFVEKGKLPGEQDVTKFIYIVDENIQKIFTYPNCDFWLEHNFYPNYSRID